MKKKILLPNPLSYMSYVQEILIDSYSQDVPTKSELPTTTFISKLLVNEDGFLVVDELEE